MLETVSVAVRNPAWVVVSANGLDERSKSGVGGGGGEIILAETVIERESASVFPRTVTLWFPRFVELVVATETEKDTVSSGVSLTDDSLAFTIGAFALVVIVAVMPMSPLK